MYFACAFTMDAAREAIVGAAAKSSFRFQNEYDVHGRYSANRPQRLFSTLPSPRMIAKVLEESNVHGWLIAAFLKETFRAQGSLTCAKPPSDSPNVSGKVASGVQLVTFLFGAPE